MTRQLTPESVSCMLNGGGGALLDTGDNDALLDVLTDYFTETIQNSEGKLVMNSLHNDIHIHVYW